MSDFIAFFVGWTYLARVGFAACRHFAAAYPPKTTVRRVRVCVGYCVVFWVCYSASIESKRKGAKVRGLQILAIVALVTGFVWAGIGVIGQSAGLVQLSAIVACIGMVAAVLSVLFVEC